MNFGDSDSAPFLHQLSKYTKVDWVKAPNLEELLEKLKAYNLVIIGFHKSDASPWARYKFSEDEQQFIQEIARNNHSILDVFTRPYALMDLKSTSNLEGIVMSYQNSEASQQKSVRLYLEL